MKKKIAILISFSGQGGVERMVCHVAGGFAAAGFEVDMLLIKAKGEHLKHIPKSVNVIKLKAQHNLTSLPEVTHYFREHNPDAMLAAKHRAIKIAALARRLSGSQARLVGRLGTTVSGALAGQGRIRKWLWYASMRKHYQSVDKLVAVSRGVADDVIAITGLPQQRVVVINNPVVVPGIHEKAREPVDHAWLQNKDMPVILGAGRLTRQKDFSTLLDALVLVLKKQAVRLLILGEGKLRGDLTEKIQALGLQQHVDMPGFAGNPYAYMAKCDLFVLSSRWEGSPNVLKEALAVGIPVVSTDCPSGPKEILQDGKYGPLVEMGDATGLAAAILTTLAAPLPAATLQEAVQDYTLEASTRAYLQAMQLAD